MIGHPHYAQAITFALDRLRQDLPADLAYHNLWHTASDVLPSSMRLAERSGVPEADLRLLAVAAAYHDVGFTETSIHHELIGARMAAQTLPDFGFSDVQIEKIMGMILATRLPQSPRNLLEEILADADLDVLGRADFWPRNVDLRQEGINYGREVPLVQWFEGQLAFLKNHCYFTAAAHTLRDEIKKQNIVLLEAKLQSLLSTPHHSGKMAAIRM